MASKDAFYLKHDFNASRDPKIVKLLRAHGAQAYGYYWMIVERLYEQGGRMDADFETIAYDLRGEAELIERIVSGFDLFTVKDGKIGSASIDRRLAERLAASEAGREFAARRWGKEGSAMGSHRGPNARRGEDRIEEEKKEDITAAAAPSAADLKRAIDKTLDAGARTQFLAKMEDSRLPFDFGDFKKGGRITDLPAETCGLILEKVPRLGLDVRRYLQERINEHKADSNHRRAS